MESGTETAGRQPKFVRWAVMLGIVIALNVFFVVVRALVFPAPQYQDFCSVAPAAPDITEAQCTAQGGTWTPIPMQDASGKLTVAAGYCDLTTKCQKPFEDAQKAYDIRAFVLTMALGLVALVIGALPLGSSIVAAGLSYGGVLAFLIASVQYWNEAGSYVRLGISGLALAALLFIGWKRFRD